MDAITNYDEDYYLTWRERVKYNNVIGVEITEDVTTEPVTLAEIKEHLMIDFTDKDNYLTRLGKVARQQIEDEINIALAPKTIKAELRNEKGYISLPYWTPNGSIVEVTDFEGEAEDEDNYTINNGVLETRFSTTVYVEYETGYEECPEKYKQMILERVAFLDANRGDQNKQNHSGVWLA